MYTPRLHVYVPYLEMGGFQTQGSSIDIFLAVECVEVGKCFTITIDSRADSGSLCVLGKLIEPSKLVLY